VSYEYERVVTPASGLRLHLNENTAGCSPAVLAALQALTRQDIAAYPDYDDAIAACASRLRVPADQLLLTNGLDEGIFLGALDALRGSSAAAPLEAIVVVPAFDMYAACTDAVGGRVVEVPLGPGFAFPLDGVLEAIGERTRLVWLTNPNNPTGQTVPRDAIERIAAAARGALVFVDEAYMDFCGDTLLDDQGVLDRMMNVVVGRTFAKAYGLAGLRAGALIGASSRLAFMRRAAAPYSLNVCAAAALPAAFADTAYYEWYVAQVAQSREMLYDFLDERGVVHWKSAANFVLARFDGNSGRVASGLAARGVHVRDRSGDPGCAGCLRMTAGVAEHTGALLAALEAIL
jgi:histidinol-phosphate aminotransferase